jgi:hypothetical protein
LTIVTFEADAVLATNGSLRLAMCTLPDCTADTMALSSGITRNSSLAALALSPQ